jgi:hypothetical protein
MKRLILCLLATASLVFTGCATSYVTPGAKADLQSFAPAGIQSGFDAKPTNPFPASIAAVRVQSPTYSNYFLQQNGGLYGSGGRYSVIMTREVEDQAQFDRISTLSQVSGVVTLNRLLLPSKLESDRELREAAARLHADLVFVYTFDTAFFDSDAASPLTVVTLGLSPTRKITAATTVSALLLDTRTGYVYSSYEATEREAIRSTSWGSMYAADKARQTTESRAFGKLIDELVNGWPKMLKAHPASGTQVPVSPASAAPAKTPSTGEAGFWK